MQRLKFMENQRVECFLLAPQAKIDKETGKRVVVLRFSVKMKADLALACDDKILRAWEEIETAEREVSSMGLRSEIEYTDIDFYELPDSNNRFYQVKNCTLDGIHIERDKGTTYLYFLTELFLYQTPGLDKFALNNYGNSCFCEFVKSQMALNDPPPSDPELPLQDGDTKVTIELEGHAPIETTAQGLHDAARRIKKAGKG